jgi:hypothetical protein
LITASSCAMSSPRAATSVATSTAAAAVGELHQHLVAVALLQVAVQFQRHDALGLQHRHQVAALLLGVAEGQRADSGRKWFSSRPTACRRWSSVTS